MTTTTMHMEGGISFKTDKPWNEKGTMEKVLIITRMIIVNPLTITVLIYVFMVIVWFVAQTIMNLIL